MRKISKRVFALALAMSTLLTACGGNGGSNAAGTETPNTEVTAPVVDNTLAAEAITVDLATYDAKSAEVYNAALGEFITAYNAAKAVLRGGFIGLNDSVRKEKRS